jgi:hypothetical protein
MTKVYKAMKNSKIILAGSTMILAIAGVFVSKAAKSSHQLHEWTCTSNGKCSASHGVINSATKLGSGATVKIGVNKAHTCTANRQGGRQRREDWIGSRRREDWIGSRRREDRIDGRREGRIDGRRRADRDGQRASGAGRFGRFGFGPAQGRHGV